MEKKKKSKDEGFNMTYRGLNGKKMGQSFIFCVIIPAYYTFSWKWKNLFTSACLNLNYGTTK